MNCQSASPPQVAVWRSDALIPRLEDYLGAQTGRRARISNLRRYTVGLSWVTIGLQLDLAPTAESTAEKLDLILRIGSPNGLLAPYSAVPEYLALTALEGRAGLPLPKAHWYSDDPAIIGAPFLITGRIEGDTPSPPWGRRVELSALPERLSMERDFADALVSIHSFDWQNSPLRTLDPGVTPENALSRELDRWSARLRDGGSPPIPGLHLTEKWLRSEMPARCNLRLVHGDYRVGNFLADDGRITAILDWELVHIGDPLEDISWMSLPIFGGTDRIIGGMFDRAAVLARYSAATGNTIDLQALQWFDVLSLYKCAIVVECARQRSRTGAVHDARVISSALQLPSTLMGMLSTLKRAL